MRRLLAPRRRREIESRRRTVAPLHPLVRIRKVPYDDTAVDERAELLRRRLDWLWEQGQAGGPLYCVYWNDEVLEGYLVGDRRVGNDKGAEADPLFLL